ncbi:MAG: enoyl-CoA hydratase [Rhodospirillales bacterium]|nr:enoyl-CoA hydratase [Rhodospirillales bacterium]
MGEHPRPDDNEPVLVRRDAGAIATLTLNRPRKYNALSIALLDALRQELEGLERACGVKVVVLAGAGKAFCAGHDLQELRDDAESAKAAFKKCADVMLAIAKLSKPVIARVHGTAAAAGCQIVASCDLAVASEEARFATSGINVGLFCATPMVALTRNVPRKVAMEMLLTGDFIDAQAALQAGLVNRVVPLPELDAAVGALAAKLAGKSAAAIAFGKRLFHRQLEAGLDAAYALASETMACNLASEDAQAGIDAFVAKKPTPAWKDK